MMEVDDETKLEQLGTQKEYLLKHIEHFDESEMNFDEANLKMVEFVKKAEQSDMLCCGNGSTWKDIIFTPSYPSTQPQSNTAGAPALQSKVNDDRSKNTDSTKCCVIA